MSRFRLLAAVALILLMAGVGGGVLLMSGGDRPGRHVSDTALAEPVPPDTVPSESPTIEPYATAPSAKAVTAAPSPVPSAAPVPRNFDGCDHSYGEISQCIPSSFPDGIKTVAGKCKWLADHQFKHLAVVGDDPQKLDPDKNKVACDN